MMTNRCFIVDDEPIAIDILVNYVQRLEDLRVTATFTNPVLAFSALQATPVDLLFLDIQMPELTGLELLQSLHRPPAVILTTAFREFALEGFNLDVVDYLLKPVSFDRFLKAIGKFRARQPAPAPDPTRLNLPGEEAGYLFIRADRRNVRVQLDDILYLESLKDYVRVVTAGQGKLLTKETLRHFEDVLPPGRFLRVHRSFLVARDKVTAQSTDGLEIGKTLIPVGRLYKLAVERELFGRR